VNQQKGKQASAGDEDKKSKEGFETLGGLGPLPHSDDLRISPLE
jgi:hypothetical protein